MTQGMQISAPLCQFHRKDHAPNVNESPAKATENCPEVAPGHDVVCAALKVPAAVPQINRGDGRVDLELMHLNRGINTS